MGGGWLRLPATYAFQEGNTVAYTLTKQLTIRYPLGHPQAGMVLASYAAGQTLLDEHLEFISPQLLPKITAEAAADTDTEPNEDDSTDDNDNGEADDSEDNGDGLSGLTVSELKEIITNEGVEVSGGSKKSNLIAAIRAHREG